MGKGEREDAILFCAIRGYCRHGGVHHKVRTLQEDKKAGLMRKSFSKQSGQACKKYGGRVHGTFRIDPNGVKGFCEPSTLPTDNDTEKREDLSNTYWLNI